MVASTLFARVGGRPRMPGSTLALLVPGFLPNPLLPRFPAAAQCACVCALTAALVPLLRSPTAERPNALIFSATSIRRFVEDTLAFLGGLVSPAELLPAARQVRRPDPRVNPVFKPGVAPACVSLNLVAACHEPGMPAPPQESFAFAFSVLETCEQRDPLCFMRGAP